jgi:hypothetical protein
MTCLRQAFEKWVNSEPEEFESERATEEQLAELEESEKLHSEMFQTTVQLAYNLSRCIGVAGNIKDKKLADSLVTFLKEGIRYAFEGDQKGDDELVLGSRLPFLGLLGRYSNHIKKDKSKLAEICDHLDQKIEDLRSNPEFEEVHDDDLNFIDEYRESLGLKQTNLSAHREEEDDESETAATPSPSRRSSRGRPSTASKRSRASAQSSLSPLMEEDATMGSSEEEEESPSPKRRRTTSRSRRSQGESAGSKSTKTSVVRTIDEGAEDEDSSTNGSDGSD